MGPVSRHTCSFVSGGVRERRLSTISRFRETASRRYRVEQATSALEILDRRLDEDLQGQPDDSTGVQVVAARDALADEELYRSVRVLAAMAALVLAGLAASVGSLIAARTEARQRELGIRTALGASRYRIVRQLGI